MAYFLKDLKVDDSNAYSSKLSPAENLYDILNPGTVCPSVGNQSIIICLRVFINRLDKYEYTGSNRYHQNNNNESFS